MLRTPWDQLSGIIMRSPAVCTHVSAWMPCASSCGWCCSMNCRICSLLMMRLLGG